jgi:uncharacterized protein YhaN
LLQRQIQQTRQERDELDAQLPATGPAVGGLEAAQRELAGLEELVPVDAQRQAARREAQAAAQRAQQAEADMTAAARRWKEAVAAASLPAGFTPKQVRELASRCRHIGHSTNRLQESRDENRQRAEELRSVTDRIALLTKEVGVGVDAPSPVERLHALAAELARQRVQFQRRTALAREIRQLHRKQARLDASIARLQHRRRILLDEVHAADEPEFRRRAASQQAARALREQRDSLRRELDAAVAGQATDDELRGLLEQETAAAVETRRAQLQSRLADCETHLRERLEKRGQLAEQLRLLAENRTPATKQLELAAVQKRLRDAVRQWQVLGITAQALETVRKRYEQTRQPECLQEASAHLRRMTEGRYSRVWTPLSDDVLMVDDAAGKSLSVEVLSHGVREQLFLSLRLALGGSYARRGAQLPMVLDDVLVNFDVKRVKAAASVLCELAATGYQFLVFTCHEHVARIFEDLGVEVKELPDHAELRPSVTSTPAPALASASVSTVEMSPQRLQRKQRKRKASPQRTYAVVTAADHPEPEPPPEVVHAHEDEDKPPASRAHEVQHARPAFGSLPGWEEDDSPTEDDAEADLRDDEPQFAGKGEAA